LKGKRQKVKGKSKKANRQLPTANRHALGFPLEKIEDRK